MSSFKKADGIIDSIQKQATGFRTLDGSAIEDFLSIAGYEDSNGGDGGMKIIPIPVSWDDDKTSFVLSMTAQEIKDGMLAGNLYSVNITEELIESAGVSWSVTTGIISAILEDSPIRVVVGLDYWSCNTLSDHPAILVD